MLPMLAKATLTTKRIPHDEFLMKKILSACCFSTSDEVVREGIKLYAQAFLFQENGGRLVLRNNVLQEQIDLTVPCLRMLTLTTEVNSENKWEFMVDIQELYLAKRLLAAGAASDEASLIRWILSYYDRVLEEGGFSEGWQYGVLVGATFLPLVIPGDPRY